jgi:DNA-binding transcriptional LysR family regulator
MSRASLAELEAVNAVARTRSFRGAAKELGISASGLSHAISSLEARLQVRLFHRSTRSVALTDEGEAFVHRLKPALEEIDAALDDVHATSEEPSGSLRIVSPRGPAEITVLPAVLEMRRRHPAVSVEVVSDARYVDIVAEGYDAGIRYAGTVPRDMVSIPCSPELRVAIVAAPSYLATRRAPQKPQDLLAHECIRYRKDSGTVRRWELRMNGREISVEVEGGLVLDDEAFLLQAALDGAGLAYLSDAAAKPHLDAGRLVRVLERYAPRFGALQLFHPSGRLVRAALRAFIAIVKEKRCG